VDEVEATTEYETEFDALSLILPDLAQDLEKGLYFTLTRAPTQKARLVHDEGVWLRTQIVYKPPTPPRRARYPYIISLFYTVDHEQQKVVLISITHRDATMM
jgi:hypothetical protein